MQWVHFIHHCTTNTDIFAERLGLKFELESLCLNLSLSAQWDCHSKHPCSSSFLKVTIVIFQFLRMAYIASDEVAFATKADA